MTKTNYFSFKFFFQNTFFYYILDEYQTVKFVYSQT